MALFQWQQFALSCCLPWYTYGLPWCGLKCPIPTRESCLWSVWLVGWVGCGQEAVGAVPLSQLLVITSFKPLITSFKSLLHLRRQTNFIGCSISIRDMLMCCENICHALASLALKAYFNHQKNDCSIYTVYHYNLWPLRLQHVPLKQTLFVVF